MPFHIIEPHPTASSYIHAGRGGAGNYARYNKTELTSGATASGPASASKTLAPPPTTSKFATSGRGGAGNTFKRSDSQRAIFSFDEELERDQRLRDNAAKAPVYHIGRGGAGNAVDEMKPLASQRMGSTSSASSTASDTSDKRRNNGVVNALGRLSRTFSRN